jgi:hypothetical protein
MLAAELEHEVADGLGDSRGEDQTVTSGVRRCCRCLLRTPNLLCSSTAPSEPVARRRTAQPKAGRGDTRCVEHVPDLL